MRDEGRSIEDIDDTDQDDSVGNNLGGMGLVIWSEKWRGLMQ